MRTRGVICAIAIAAAAVALALPAAAGAETFCVKEPACVAAGGHKVEGKNAIALTSALSEAAANPGPDSIVIGAGTFEAPKGFEYNSSEPVTITGASPAETRLASSEKGTHALVLNSGVSTVVSNLAIEMPPLESVEGLVLNGATAEHVAVTGGGGEGLPIGLRISGGVFAHGSVELERATTTDAVSMSGGEVVDSTIVGSYGLEAGAPSATVRGSRISGAINSYNGALTIEDTLVDLRGAPGAGVIIAANDGNSETATLRGDTIVNGGESSSGLEVEAYKPEGKATKTTVLLEGSIISHVATPIALRATEPMTSIAATARYSSFEAGADTEAGATLDDEKPAASTPDFVKPVFGEAAFSEGNWHLAPVSPLIDAGPPEALSAGEYGLDAEAAPRLVGGRRDVGAFEYQRRPPVIATTASTTSPTVGQSIVFGATAIAPEPGDGITKYQWTFDDGAVVPAGAAVAHAFKTLGVHTATVTVTDTIGVSAAAVVSVDVVPPFVFRCTCVAVHPNLLTALRLAPRSFRAARHGSSIARVRTGASVSYQLGRAAVVRFALERAVPGVMHGGLCARPRHGLRGRRCTRHVPMAGLFTRNSVAGANSFRFTGRLRGRALAPGSYLLLASPVGEPGSDGTIAAFRIVR
jgi:hypothetical protein